MAQATEKSRVIRFGVFEANLHTHELRKYGLKVRLQEQPFQVLELLLERPGELVSREEIRVKLWPQDTFVDFEQGLNAAVRRLRNALNDEAGTPRFVETLPRRGYRFIAEIVSANGEANFPLEVGSGAVPAIPEIHPAEVPWKKRSVYGISIAAAILTSAAICLAFNVGGLRDRVFGPKTSSIHSIAVLPLVNLSGNPSQEYFADGVTDELITMLATNTRLRVVSRTTVMQYKGVHRPLRDLAHQLGVDAILEGSFERSDRKLHMTVQLVRADSDSHIWAHSYDRDTDDVAALPNEIALTIAKRLNSSVPAAKEQRYVNPEAHDAYLHGRYLWFAANDDEAYKYFKKATELQPDYALGWSGLTDSYFTRILYGNLDPRTSLALMWNAATKALQLDDSVPQTHVSMCAAILMVRWDLEAADQECRRAIEIDPEYSNSYHVHARILSFLNRPQEAVEVQEKGDTVDPVSSPWALIQIYIFNRQFDLAQKEALERIQSAPYNPVLHSQLSDIYRREGMQKESVEELEKTLTYSGLLASADGLKESFKRGSYEDVLRWQIDNLKSRASRQYVSPISLALLYAQLNDREKTLEMLEEGFRHHHPGLLEIQTDPAYDFLHHDPRYRIIIQKMGLPPV